MAEQIHYKRTTTNEDQRCEVLLPNQMQCPSRSQFQMIAKNKDGSERKFFRCSHHFNIALVKAKDNDIDYIDDDDNSDVVLGNLEPHQTDPANAQTQALKAK